MNKICDVCGKEITGDYSVLTERLVLKTNESHWHICNHKLEPMAMSDICPCCMIKITKFVIGLREENNNA